MLTNFLQRLLLFFFISSKKFQAKTKIQSTFLEILSFPTIDILTPGKYLPCFNLLSSTIKSISWEIPKKFNAVVALAGAP